MIILLYGQLGKQFGRKHDMHVASASEAIRALEANYPGFRKELLQENAGFNIFVGYDRVRVQDAYNPIGQREVCRIVPAVSGAGTGIGEAVAWYIASQAAISTTTLAIITFAVNAVVALAIQGIVSALFAPPKPSIGSSERPENSPSYTFNGAVNTMAQGHPVPVGYGRLRVGSQVISAGLSAEQIPV